MKQTIEFNDSTTSPIDNKSPWALSSKTSYQDRILEPEFEARRFKFPLGSTWFRIVPALRGSDKGWMLGIHALQYPKGRHAHPKTIHPGTKSVFDYTYAWLKEYQSDALYSKANKEGYRLLADPLCLFWMLVEEEGKTMARLLLASGYDGSRGGVPGLGHQIWQLAQEVDEDGNLLGNPADPVKGVQICVEKRQTPGARYPSYSLKRGRVPAPIQEMLGKLDSEEAAALMPLEKVVHQTDKDEEWHLLEQVVPADTLSKIRDSIH